MFSHKITTFLLHYRKRGYEMQSASPRIAGKVCSTKGMDRYADHFTKVGFPLPNNHAGSNLYTIV